MEIYYTRTKVKKNIIFKGRVSDFFGIENINPETVILIKGDTVLTGDSVLKNSDKISILPVISGG